MIGGRGMDERSINFEPIDGDAGQIGQGRIAGAKGVNRNRGPMSRNACGVLTAVSSPPASKLSVISNSSH